MFSVVEESFQGCYTCSFFDISFDKFLSHPDIIIIISIYFLELNITGVKHFFFFVNIQNRSIES